MSRLLVHILALICLPLAVCAAEPLRHAPRPLASALHAAQGERWEVAARLATRDGPVAADLIEWQRLRAGHGSAEDVMAFLRRNPDWPGLGYLRRSSEVRIAAGGDAAILEFYRDHAPETGIGALSYAKAQIAAGERGEAEATIVMAWRTMDLSKAEHDAFISDYGELLLPHHEARMHMALWRGLKDVSDMRPLVSAELRNQVTARQTMQSRRDAPDKYLADLPAKLRRSSHVAFAEFMHLVDQSRTERAIRVILRQSRMENGLGEPARWSNHRRTLARAQMRAGNYKTAYDLASSHGLAEGAHYADLEWLSGYLALRFMDDAELALDHFQRFSAAVETPISLGRAGYWIGRAQEALGDVEAAQLAYAQGAEHQTSFYGLLSAERGDVAPDPGLSGRETFAPWRGSAMAGSSVARAGILALAADRPDLAERFFVHMAETLDRASLGQLAAMLGDLGRPHLQVMVGKRAAQRGIVLPAAYYALHPMTRIRMPVPQELALTIARRESEFDPGVVSGAGAQGLMQLMPGTAKEVARDLGLRHDQRRVIEDWRYNMTLGTTYLAQLADWLDGNIVLIAVGYNAGPGRARQWIERFGDPRSDDVDVVDWIESIPFRETQNYVMRVAESLPIYRARLGKDPMPAPFTRELKGATISADWDTLGEGDAADRP